MRLIMTQKNFYIKHILKVLQKFVDGVFIKKNFDNSILIITNNAYVVAKILQLNSFYKLTCLNDICVTDNPNSQKRFEINYNLLSINCNFRFFLKTYTATQTRSLTSLYDSAN